MVKKYYLPLPKVNNLVILDVYGWDSVARDSVVTSLDGLGNTLFIE